MIESILQAGIQGVQNGLDQFGRASQQVVTSTNSTSTSNSGSLESSVVELKQGQRSVEASAKVIAVADETIGSIINELA